MDNIITVTGDIFSVLKVTFPNHTSLLLTFSIQDFYLLTEYCYSVVKDTSSTSAA